MTVKTNAAGANAKRRNHTVPKALLKRWLVNHAGVQGLWVLDCAAGKVSFHPGDEAAFAIRDYRYVPIRTDANGQAYRDETVEDWFSQGENDLAAVTELALSGQLAAVKPSMLGGLVQAIILLGFRSSYEFDRIANLFASQHTGWTPDDVDRALVDHYARAYSAKLAQFKNWDYHLMPVDDASLLVCDRPTFDASLHRPPTPMLTTPLAKNLLMIATPPATHQRTRGNLSVGWLTYKPHLVAKVNEWTVERARAFVVGDPNVLAALQPKFAGNALAARMAADSLREI